MAKAVPAPSVSTTLRTATAPAAAGLVAEEGAGFPEGAAETPGAPPGFGAWEAPGSGGLGAGMATVAPALAGLGPTPAGRGGREIRMVSLRRSDGGLAPPGTGGTAGAAAPPGAEGMLGMPGVGAGGKLGTTGIAGLGGLNRMVSFFMPGGTGA